MILVIWILGLEQLDFRLEQGEEEGFLEGFWIYVEFNQDSVYDHFRFSNKRLN